LNIRLGRPALVIAAAPVSADNGVGGGCTN
jgi:hypothetical protein